MACAAEAFAVLFIPYRHIAGVLHHKSVVVFRKDSANFYSGARSVSDWVDFMMPFVCKNGYLWK